MDDELLTVDEAAAAYDVSPLTLRRRAQYGEIEGAVKVRGRRGQEWRIPPQTLESLGYVRKDAGGDEQRDIVVVVRRLAESLAEAHTENARLNRELGGAVAEAAALRRQLDAHQRLRTVVPRNGEDVVIDLRSQQEAVER